MNNIKKIIYRGLFSLLAVLTIESTAFALDFTIDKEEVDSYGVQELSIKVKNDQDQDIEIESLLLNNQNNIINKSSVEKEVKKGEDLDLKLYMQIVGGAYRIKIQLKDTLSDKNLTKAKYIKIKGAAEAVIEVINPEINLTVGEKFIIKDHKLDVVFTDGTRKKADLEPVDAQEIDTQKLGKIKVPVKWSVDRGKFSGQVDMHFDVKEARPVKSITPISKSIRLGEETSLPDKVEVVYEDGTSEYKEVTWDKLDEKYKKEAGTYDLNGRVAGTIRLAQFRLLVENYKLEDEYSFKNEELGAVIKEKLEKKEEEKVTYKDLLDVKDLSLAWALYSDGNIEDLRYLKNLEKLDASQQMLQLSNLSAISELEKLKTLNLFGDKLDSISFLKDLVSLEDLNLGMNNIGDTSALKSLINLKSLNLASNKNIKDIKALRWTNKLTDLSVPPKLDNTPVVEYNDKLKNPLKITLLEGENGKLKTTIERGSEYLLPYAVKLDGEIVYVNWEKDKITAEGIKEVKGDSEGKEITLTISEITKADDEVIDLKDKVLEDLVRKNIDKKFGQITYGDVKNLQYLEISGKNVKDFSALKDFKGLKIFIVWANENFGNEEIKLIREMKKLEQVDFGSTKVNSINEDTFKGLTELKEIALNGNKLIDISKNAFKTNIKLESLHLDNTGISNLNFLEGPENLEMLSVEENNIKDVTGLKFTPNLKWLDIGYNKIVNAKAIGELKKLEHLTISNNSISDISNFKAMTELQSIRANKNQISSISALQDSKKLKYFYMDDNSIADLEPLRDKVELRQLQVKNNKVKNVEALKGLINLKVLWLSGNPITDFSPLMPIYGNLTNKDFDL